jgi:hypothetical protein
MANFKKNSRYNNRVVENDRDGQQFITLRQPLNLEHSSGDIFVTINQELTQRPDLIAFRAYGDSTLWWVIYEYNDISDPLFELQIGQILRIPELSRVRQRLADTR